MFRLITKTEIDKNSESKSGIYKIYWIKNNVPQRINRFFGTDVSGLLYIGQAKGSVQGRLNNFRCTAFLNSNNHSGAKKYRQFGVINKFINSEEFFAEVMYCDNPLEREKQELDKYRNKFGEIPPLNG